MRRGLPPNFAEGMDFMTQLSASLVNRIEVFTVKLEGRKVWSAWYSWNAARLYC